MPRGSKSQGWVRPGPSNVLLCLGSEIDMKPQNYTKHPLKKRESKQQTCALNPGFSSSPVLQAISTDICIYIKKSWKRQTTHHLSRLELFFRLRFLSSRRDEQPACITCACRSRSFKLAVECKSCGRQGLELHLGTFIRH